MPTDKSTAAEPRKKAADSAGLSWLEITGVKPRRGSFALNRAVACFAADRGLTVVEMVPLRQSGGEKKAAELWREEILQYRSREDITDSGAFNGPNGVGVIPGRPAPGKSGIVVIDIDGEEGEETWAALCEGHDLPETMTIQTHSGRHLLFLDGGVQYKTQSKQMGAGIDVRGRGGLILIFDLSQPERHPTSLLEPAEIPEWLRPLIPLADSRAPSRGSRGSGASLGELARNGIPPGQHETTLNSMAIKLAASNEGWTQDEWVAHAKGILFRSEEGTDAKGHHDREKFTDEKLIGIWDSALEYLAEESKGGPVTLAPIPAYPVDAIPGPLRNLTDSADNLPPALVAGAGLAALSGACAGAELVMPDGTVQYPALWVPLMGPRGGGKTPALDLAFATFRELDADEHGKFRSAMADWLSLPRDKRGLRPGDPTAIIDDFTVEMLARFLDNGDGTGIAVSDELSGFLTGLGRYNKDARGSDRSRFISLWNCRLWRYQRVTSHIDISIPNPVMSVVGGIQPHLHSLLGDDKTGMRPRWLPHIVPLTDVKWANSPIAPREWDDTIADLYEKRSPRSWSLNGEALRLWKNASARWKGESRSREASSSLSAALVKADVQSARIALVIAESLNPVGAGQIPPEAMSASIAIIEFVMGCWRTLPSYDEWIIGRRDAVVKPKVSELLDWLEQHGGKATKRELQQYRVAGISSAKEADMLLDEFAQQYPGTVKNERTGTRGPATKVVHVPRRGNS
jgi:hypothetical protein